MFVCVYVYITNRCILLCRLVQSVKNSIHVQMQLIVLTDVLLLVINASSALSIMSLDTSNIADSKVTFSDSIIHLFIKWSDWRILVGLSVSNHNILLVVSGVIEKSNIPVL